MIEAIIGIWPNRQQPRARDQRESHEEVDILTYGNMQTMAGSARGRKSVKIFKVTGQTTLS